MVERSACKQRLACGCHFKRKVTLGGGFTSLFLFWRSCILIRLTNPTEKTIDTYGGCRKFLLLFGRIGPLALRPCALLRAWGFLPHSINILQIPLWYGDMMWCMVCLALALAPSCAALHFWCLYIMLSKSYLPRRCDWKDGVFYKSPYRYLGQPQWCQQSHLISLSMLDFLWIPWISPTKIPACSQRCKPLSVEVWVELSSLKALDLEILVSGSSWSSVESSPGGHEKPLFKGHESPSYF